MAKLNATDLGYTTLPDIRDNHFFALSDNNDKRLCSFDVPPFQRGYVWRPHQAELLWDSLARGLPIGTFVASETPKKGRFHLVDGRQRVTSIRLGFHDPFRTSKKNENENPPPDPLSTHNQMLWIDIDYRPTTERMFLFRVTTLFHPWGFPDSTSSLRLESSKMRAAYLAYKHIYNHTPGNGRTWRNNTDLLEAISKIPFAYQGR